MQQCIAALQWVAELQWVIFQAKFSQAGLLAICHATKKTLVVCMLCKLLLTLLQVKQAMLRAQLCNDNCRRVKTMGDEASSLLTVGASQLHHCRHVAMLLLFLLLLPREAE